MNEANIIKQGGRIRFRQATEADLDYIIMVEFAPENAQYVIPYAREQHQETLHTSGAKHIVIETADGEQRIGFLMIAGLDNPFKEIEFTRIIMDIKGKGYGRESLRLLQAWAFEDLKFHRAWLDCKDHNARALHLYESEGFVREGLIRETILTEGVYENLVILGLLDREYFAAKQSKR